MEQYKTEKEAKKILSKLQKEYEVFCPVIKAQCKDDCICFITGHLRTVKCALRDQPDYFYVYGPSCSHVLISQDIYVDQ